MLVAVGDPNISKNSLVSGFRFFLWKSVRFGNRLFVSKKWWFGVRFGSRTWNFEIKAVGFRGFGSFYPKRKGSRVQFGPSWFLAQRGVHYLFFAFKIGWMAICILFLFCLWNPLELSSWMPSKLHGTNFFNHHPALRVLVKNRRLYHQFWIQILMGEKDFENRFTKCRGYSEDAK